MKLNLTVAARSDIGCVRKQNEDAFVIADLTGDTCPLAESITKFQVGEKGVLLAVSDGEAVVCAPDAPHPRGSCVLLRAVRNDTVLRTGRNEESLWQSVTRVQRPGGGR